MNVTAVSFGGMAASSFTVVSSNAILAVVGAGASGSVSVTTAAGTVTLSGFQYIALVPTITSFSPTSGVIGTTVTITGTNFSTIPTNNIVYFGAVKATVSAATSTSLTVTVPSGATFQPITVATNNLTAFSSKPFIVTFSGGGSAFTSSSFQTKQDFSVGTFPTFPTASDLDGDGKPDVLVSNLNSNTISIFRNNSNSIGSISLTNKLDISAGTSPFGNAIFDLDGDGKQDLVVCNYYNTNTLSIYKNNSTQGNISFTTPITYSTASNPEVVVVGDVDGDGKPDLMVSSYNGNSVSVFLNTSISGNLSFANKVDFTLGTSPFKIAFGDIDGDGKPDIVAANQAGYTISVLLNLSTIGNAVFAPKVDFAAPKGSRSIAIWDIDGDGKQDIVVGNYLSNSISVFRNTSSVSSVSLATRIDATAITGSFDLDISLMDVDGDGKIDILAANQSPANQVSVFKNISSIGSVSLNQPVNYSTGANPYSLTNADLDGDGKPEIITSNQSDNTISILRNQIGEPVITTFSPTSAASGSSVIISGVNFSGITAVSFGGVAATSFTVVSSTAIVATVGAGASGSIKVTGSNGTATIAGFTFLVPVPTITSFSPISGAIGTTVTITGTNFSTTPANNIVYFGAVKANVMAATATSLTVTVPTGATYQPITVTTNSLTAFSASPFIVTFIGGGGTLVASSFAANQDFKTSTNPIYPTESDVDGDGKPDLLFSNQVSGTISILRNTSTNVGNVSFANKIELVDNNGPTNIAACDFNGDGKPDIAVSNYNNNSIWVYQNTSTVGNISFSSPITYSTGSGPYAGVFGDVDGDGKPDIIVPNAASNTISVYLNTSTVGNISFSSKVDFATGQSPWKIAIGDIDGDGKPEIIIGNQSGSTISVLRNTSSVGIAAFATKVDFTAASGPRGVAVGDIDGDGKLDIVVSNLNSTVSVFRNTSSIGNISLATRVDAAAISGSYAIDVALADIDGDGKVDILSADASTANKVSIFKNNSSSGSISLSNAVNYTVGSNPYSLTAGDLDGDGKPEIITMNITGATFSVLLNQIGNTVITSFTPTSAAVGSSVIISGLNFSGITAVSFGGVAATSFTVVSSTAIVATVGAGASGNITVTGSNGTATIDGFTFLVPVPTITTFSPVSGTIGTTVTITGANFSSTPANNIVWFGAAKATVTAATATSLTVIVPAGATFQPITVTTNNLTAFSAMPFIVTFSGGGGSFTSNTYGVKSAYSVSQSPKSIYIQDIDGDNKPDMIATDNANSRLIISRNIGTGTGNISFSTNSSQTTSSTPFGLCTADFDGDGKADIAIGYSNNSANSTTGSIGIFKNNSSTGNISLSSEITYSTLGATTFVTAGDFDGDGKPDLVVGYGYGIPYVSVFKNTSTNGNISFSSNRIDLNIYAGANNEPLAVAIGDVDGDGKIDIACANLGSPNIAILRNTSSGIGNIAFASQVGFAVGASGCGPRCISIGDLDGDGKPELIVGNAYATNIVILKNTCIVGSLSFASQSISLSSSVQPTNIGIADVDGDGKLDITVSNGPSANNITAIRNISSTGTIAFDSPIYYSLNATGLYCIAVGDLDGDGKPDIATGSTPVVVLRNQVGEPVITSFTPTSAAAGSSVIVSGVNFTGVTAVSFGGVPATSFTVVSSTALIATVGAGTSGSIAVTCTNGTATIAGFTYIAPVSVSSFSPMIATIGTAVTIKGSNLLGATAVSFGNISASNFLVIDSSTIVAIVGTGASGNVQVVTPNGSASLAGFVYSSCSPVTATINKTVCSSYTWHGTTYTISGTYTFDSLNAKGCDSLTTLNLTVNYPTTATINKTVCSSYSWHGKTYTISGTYTFDSLNAKGCDSLTTLNLTVNYPTTATITKTVCSSYTWHGKTYSTSGTYTFDSLNAKGCDSLTTLNLTVNYPTIATINKTVCSSYTWHGKTYSTSGTYTFDSLNAKGCDSLTTLNLTVNYPTTATITKTVCSSYTWHGTTYTTSGTYTFDSLNAKGCDSLTTLNLTVNYPTTTTINKTVCSSYTWHGITYTTSGTYTFDSLNAKGCDSLTTLNLTVNYPTTATINKTVCSSYTWHGTTYTTSGNYTFDSLNAKGCDSLTTLNLTVNYSTTATINKTVCSSYSWHGKTYTISGIYTFDSLNVKGCDSLTTLNLTVNYPTTSTTNMTINQGDSTLFNGIYYKTPGSYTVHLNNSKGCDSAATLVLSVNTAFSISGNIYHPKGTVIPTVSVGLSDGAKTTCDASGNYSFRGLTGGNYTVTPSKNNDVNKTNGVTVLDAILVQSHILGKVLLNSPYKIIAADVDNSGSVTVLDIIYMKRLILGIDTTFKGNRLWAFVDSSYQFADVTKPFPHKDSISVSNITTNQIGKSFIGVKLGDVNWDWNSAVAGISTTINKPIELYYNNINTTNESEIRVPIRVNNFKDILGMQYTLNYNKEVLELKSIENNQLDMEYGVNRNNEGKVSFIWTEPKLVSKSLNNGDLLMELVFTKKGEIMNEDISISNDIAPIEAWKSNYTKVGIVKTNGKIAGSTVNAINMDNWNVAPNPSNGVVKTNLSLTQSKDIQFQLTTLEGKVIMTKKVSALKGNSTNTLNLQQQTKLAAGVYYLKAVGIEGETTKWIIIE